MIKKITLKKINIALAVIFIVFSQNSWSQDADELFSSIKTVVIDAGHGGKDPGCHGASAKEKHVCLSIALMLGEMITQKYPKMNVVYTRKTDVFVELDQRAKIANENKADLFICIHANAASAAAYGTETYVLGLHKTKSQQDVALRENSIIHFENNAEEKYKDFDMSPDAIIARQLQLSVYLDQSISFASKLQTQFKSIGRHDRGVKQAGFLVLYKTTMPSVLIETGFLTNPKEEKFLSNSKTQALMAASMFKAFQSYKNELEGVDEKIEEVNLEDYDTTIVSEELLTSSPKETLTDDDVVFKVQIETSKEKLPLYSKRFKGQLVSEYKQDDLYKYTVGESINDFDKANELKKKLRSEGFSHAFVVAFHKGIRINLQKAIKLAEK